MNGNSRQIWIIGAGNVGRRALKLLGADHSTELITVVDRRPHRADASPVVEMDGVSFLKQHLANTTDAWIVPAVPFHLAFEYLRALIPRDHSFRKISPPETLLKEIPNVDHGPDHRRYVSNATFLCPTDCSEPDICTTTGEPRPLTMHEHLASMCPSGFVPLVVQSHQLAPGVGGFAAEDLPQAASRILKSPGKYLVATACRCHGVVDAFSIE